LLIAPIKVGYNSLIRPGFGKNIEGTKPQLLKEVHFCRSWLRRSGSYPSYRENLIAVPTYRQVLGVVAQGSAANNMAIKTYFDETAEFTLDPLRLLRATNALVVPTRHVIRLLATSEDVTHS
jgi:heme/copper-type cytochrome/quinol oxidase subunit 2